MTPQKPVAAAMIALLAAALPAVAAPPSAPSDPAVAAYRAQIAAAEKSLRLEESRELRRWLSACEPALRGWEWRHLNAICDTSRRRVGTTEGPRFIEMSPKGDRLASVEGATVRVLSWPDLDEIAVIDGHDDAVYRAAFGPHGRRLVTVSRDVTSRTWNLETGAEIARMDLANPAVAAVAIDAAGTTAATCAWERDDDGGVHGVVWIWNPETGAVRHRRRVGAKPLSAIRFLPGGAGIVTGSWDGIVHQLDRAGNETRRFVLPDEGIYNAVNDIAVSRDGRYVAAASKDRTTRVFAVDTGDLVASLRGHGGYVEALAFAPDGAHLATASGDTTCALWRTTDWTRRAILRGATDTVSGIAWSAEGNAIVAAGRDRAIRIWDADVNDTARTEIRTGADGIYSTTLSPDGNTVAVACYDGWLRLFDARSGALRNAWEAHPGSTCHGAAFSGDGRLLVTASWDKTARVRDARDGSELAVLDAEDGVYAVAITPDGARVATSGDTLQIWDVDRTERLHRIAIEGAGPRRLAFSADGARVASGWSDGAARIHDTAHSTLIATLRGGDARVETVAFLGGGTRVATGDAAGVVRVFPARGGDAEFAIDTGGRAVNQVACFGNRIAAATDQLWLIDAERGGIVLGVRPQTDSIWHIDWSRQTARVFATCAINGTICILNDGSSDEY